MWLKRFFIETPVDFERQCRKRILVGAVAAVLGAVTMLLPMITGQLPVLYLQPGWKEFVPGFYRGIGIGFFAAGLVLIIRNLRYLKNDKLKTERQIYETDERNRMLGLRCWAYAGYSMFLLLYIGIIISGLISLTTMKTLMAVAALYAILLLVFRRLLQHSM